MSTSEPLPCRSSPELWQGERMDDIKLIDSVLGEGGKLLGKEMTFRREQRELAVSVAQALKGGKHLVAEAGTGVGKSIGYLVPAAIWAVRNKSKILISTHTKALQEQLIQKDLPAVCDALAEPLGERPTYARFMGSENYLCRRRLQLSGHTGIFEKASHEEDLITLAKYVNAHPVSSGAGGLRHELPDVPTAVWQLVKREADNCMSRKSPFYEQCYHREALMTAQNVQLVVVNHALFFTNLAAGKRILPNYEAVIFDEAHVLEEVAAGHLSVEISNLAVKRLLDEVAPAKGASTTHRFGRLTRFDGLTDAWIKKVTTHSGRVREKAERFFEKWFKTFDRAQVGRRGGGDENAFRVRDTGGIENDLSGTLVTLGEWLESGAEKVNAPDQRQEVSAAAARCHRLAASIEEFMKMDDDSRVYWVSSGGSGRFRRIQLNQTPMDLSDELRRLLFSGDGPVSILTSATLTVKNEFEYLHSRIGSERAHTILLGSPFDFKKQAMLYLPDGIPDPASDQAYERAVIGHVGELIQACPGGIFVLCTSHRFLNEAHRALSAESNARPFFKQDDSAPYKILEDFRKAGNGVLFGTSTFWQGVDVAGDALSLVVITRLPFAQPTHPLEQARIEHLERQGKNAFSHYTLPRAALMLRQGFGRLIRRSSDRGVVAILDPRVKTREYGRVFLKSLPETRVTSLLSDVRSFFKRS